MSFSVALDIDLGESQALTAKDLNLPVRNRMLGGVGAGAMTTDLTQLMLATLLLLATGIRAAELADDFVVFIRSNEHPFFDTVLCECSSCRSCSTVLNAG